ncbi:hypothetical protein [Hymenobacter cellulosivorans]|uniref:SRPBCC family protein n=1 Tax=Hymenobacter cellulosivorans TaxID=2932249 RepID=A0ABY4F9W6_9BACT|nr:hypothetical protein [Hymenobacter cellulosivorans]UOQ53455.1 hypothetical protein MUN80_01540 [Hymenobacter cellulosivorans]
MPFVQRRYAHYFIAVLAGLFFALLGRFTFASELLNQGGGLLMLGFLVLIPLGLGAVTEHFAPSADVKGFAFLWRPWLASILFMVTAFVFHLEGFICLLIISPLYVVMSLLGAAFYRILTRNRPGPNGRRSTFIVAGFALLPFVAAPLESQFAAPDDFRRVENTILINAPVEAVWHNIIRVPAISAQDLGPSLIDKIGFPRPVEATLSFEGVGGVRHATFERGVEFIETVDVWEPLRRISFSIVPNTATIPPTTFDEHVTVGGRFFDVLRGTYELQPAGPGQTRLILYSQQRLSTRLNPYAGLWTDYVMSEIQARILRVVAKRSEAEAAQATSASGIVSGRH